MIAPHVASHPSVAADVAVPRAVARTAGASGATGCQPRFKKETLLRARAAPRAALAGLAAVACRSACRQTAKRHQRHQCRAVLPRFEGLSSLDPVHVTETHREPPSPHGAPLSVTPEPELAAVVRQLYASFNQCDAHRTAACFTEDVVYEDLLLGNSTIVQSRAEFLELIRTHPVFVSARACGMLGLPPLDIKVEVDNISEDIKRSTVGVEWHVEVGGQPLVLGRGLSFMKIDPETGLIAKATDIAEAPWRAIGLVLSPFARGIRELSRLLRDWSFSSVITVVLFAVLFMDQSSLDQLRDDIDTLDDFRKGLDQSDHNGLKALLAEMVAKNPPR